VVKKSGKYLCLELPIFHSQWFCVEPIEQEVKRPPPAMPKPRTILDVLEFISPAAMAVCQAIDKALWLEREERQALKNLRKGVEGLRSDTMVYKLLLNSMENDTALNGRSPYTRFIQQYAIGLQSTS
jgi:hypothetical protein